MPVYNAAKYIRRAIHSVTEQTFADWELIIINDGSTDNSLKIIDEVAGIDSRIHVISQANSKQAAARNAGLRVAQGDWVAFIDADDEWNNRKLEIQLRDSEKADVLFCKGYIFEEITGSSRPYPSVSGKFSGKEMYKILFFKNPIANLAVMIKKELIARAGYQNELSRNLTGCEDWEFWMRLANSGATFFGSDDFLFKYRIHDSNTSGNDLNMKIAEINAIYLSLNKSLFEKGEITNRLNPLIDSSVTELLLRDNKKDALKLLHIKNEITPSLRISLSYFFLRYLTFFKGKYLLGLIYPGRYMSSLNNQASAI